MDFSVVQESVKSVIDRIRDPFSFLDFQLDDQDTMTELSIYDKGSSNPVLLVAFSDSDVRVLKNVSLDSEYISESYDDYVHLFSLLLRILYPLYVHYNKSFSYVTFCSVVLDHKIRIWKDLVRFIFSKSGIDFVEGADYFTFKDYYLSVRDGLLVVRNKAETSFKYDSARSLVLAILASLQTIFDIYDIDVNPLLSSDRQDAVLMEEQKANQLEEASGENSDSSSDEENNGSAQSIADIKNSLIEENTSEANQENVETANEEEGV
jgi:hypothetical protein